MNKKLIALLFVAGISAAGVSAESKAFAGLRTHYRNKIAQYQKNISKLEGYVVAGEKLLTSGKVLSAHQLAETKKTIAKNRLRIKRQGQRIEELRSRLQAFFNTRS